MDFQRPHTPDDSIRRAPSPLDDPMSFQRDPDNQHGFPFDPPADEDSEDEDNEDMSSPAHEDSEEEDNEDTMLGENPSDDENTGGIAANDSDNNESAAPNAPVQPTLPMLILANDMIDNIKTACLEDDLPDKMLARLRSPPREPDALNPITKTSMGIFNALVSGSQRMYNSVRHVLSQHRPTPIIIDSSHRKAKD